MVIASNDPRPGKAPMMIPTSVPATTANRASIEVSILRALKKASISIASGYPVCIFLEKLLEQ